MQSRMKHKQVQAAPGYSLVNLDEYLFERLPHSQSLFINTCHGKPKVICNTMQCTHVLTCNIIESARQIHKVFGRFQQIVLRDAQTSRTIFATASQLCPLLLAQMEVQKARASRAARVSIVWASLWLFVEIY